MRRRLLRWSPVGLIALALGLPVLATAETATSAEQQARVQGFDLEEKLGPDTELVESGPNEGLFRVELDNGSALLTHGPDKAPAAGEHGTSLGPGDPERDPVCASTNKQHVLYGVPAGRTDRLATVAPDLRAAVRRMNAVLNSESLESGGGELDYRILCDGGGEIKVDSFVGPAGDDSFGAVSQAAAAAGFSDPDTKYTIFYDTNASGGYCGVGSMYYDDRPGAENWNNGSSRRASYAVTHQGCWYGLTPMHENGHNMGAVQPGAPKSTGDGGHCFQEHDLMCYSPDGGDRNQGGATYDCTDHLHFDCGHDDYFDAAPQAGGYLATHWNIGSPVNRYLAFGPPAENEPPVADFSVDCAGLTCAFRDTSRDPDGRVSTRAWRLGDSGSSTLTNPSHTFPAQGDHEVSLTVTDDRGASHTHSRTVTVRDLERPSVVAVAPADRATGVAPATNVTARFSEPMRATTLIPATVTVTRVGSTTAVPATVRPDPGARRVTVDPSAPLVRGATYTARVGAGVRDVAGNGLSPSKAWRFTVRR